MRAIYDYIQCSDCGLYITLEPKGNMLLSHCTYCKDVICLGCGGENKVRACNSCIDEAKKTSSLPGERWGYPACRKCGGNKWNNGKRVNVCCVCGVKFNRGDKNYVT